MGDTSRNGWKIAAGIAGAVAGCAGALSVWSHVRYGRSLAATGLERCQFLSGERQHMVEPPAYDRYMEDAAVENELPYHLPRWLRLRSLVFQETVSSMKTYHLNTTGKNPVGVLYLHGDTYTDQVSVRHWLFCDRLAQATGAEVCVPIYPLAPKHDYDEAYDLVKGLYRGMVSRYGADHVVLMGDSAGGGFAAGLAESLPQLGVGQPGALVLISPWVDLSMRNPASTDHADEDPTLAVWGLSEMGKSWADGDDPTLYRLSPIYGDVSVLRNVTIYVGTREILYPDAMAFADRLRQAGVDVRLEVGANLGHSWPLHPTPEGCRACDDIAKVVSGLE